MKFFEVLAVFEIEARVSVSGNDIEVVESFFCNWFFIEPDCIASVAVFLVFFWGVAEIMLLE